jgi:anti-sigma factor RsiW
MICRDFIEFLLDYDEGRLPAEVHAQFDAHLAECPDCVNYLASYRTTRALGKQAFADPESALPDHVPAELVQAILALRATIDRGAP